MITQVLIREAGEDWTAEEGKMLLALQVEEGAKNQGMQGVQF